MVRILLRVLLILTITVPNGPALFCQSKAVDAMADSVICVNSGVERLLWRDDFSGDQIDTNRWATFYPYGADGSDACSFCRTHSTVEHRENQIFLDENVIVEDGVARIEVKRERASWYEFDERFTSGVLYSRSTLRGPSWRAEMRARVPTTKGIWPAFWMFGGSTEIDVFEFYGKKSGRQASLEHFESSVHHWDNDSPTWNNLWSHAPAAADSFHVYGVEVTPGYISFQFDGREIGRFNKFTDSTGLAVSGCTLKGGQRYLIQDEFPAAGAEVAIIAGVGVRRKPRKLPPPMVIDWVAVWVRE